MSDMSLAVINTQLARANIPVVLSPDTAARLKTMASRDRLLQAVKHAASDKGERTWLIGIMSRAGLKFASANNNDAEGDLANAPSTAPAAAPPSSGSKQPRIGVAGKRTQTESAEPATARVAKNEQPPHAEGGKTMQMDEADRLSVHVYGGKAALSFEADKARDGAHTVSIDAALSVGERQYDWSSKIRLQLTARELPVVTAVMLGLAPRCEFKNHGRNNDKGFSMECQNNKGAGSVFVRVFAKDQTLRAVPVDAADAWRVGTLLLRQLRRQCPWMDGAALSLNLRALAARIVAPGGTA